MSNQHEKIEAKHEIKPGSHLLLTLTNNDTGKVVLKEEHEVVAMPKEKQSHVELMPMSICSNHRSNHDS